MLMRKVWMACTAIIMLASCQKEVGFDSPGGGTGTTGELLVKTVAVTGNDTMTTLYTYDSQKRLETMTIDGTSTGMVMHSYQKFVRDANGRIIRVLQKIDQNGMASDTAINNIHYPDATTMNFDYSVNNISMMGFDVKDSSVYTYTGGRMTRISAYMSSPLMGPDPIATTITDFSYDAFGNVSVLDMAADITTPGTVEPVMKQTYTYGNSLYTSYMSQHAAQNLFLAGFPNAQSKAVTKMVMEDLTTPSNGFTLTTDIVTGAGNKPVSATATNTSGTQGTTVTKYTFYYQ